MQKSEHQSFIEVIEAKIDKFFEMHEGNSPESGLYERVVREVERALIKRTIDHTHGVQIQASKILGINRNTLRKKMKELGI